MSKVVLLWSGGLDSTVLLWKLWAEGHEVRPMFMHYGATHNGQESRAVSKILQHPKAVSMRLRESLIERNPEIEKFGALFGRSEKIPEGHYEAESMKATVVPNRNMIFLATAASTAVAIGYDAVAYAAHGGDHVIYPDCRPEFVHAMRDALRLGCGVDLMAPFAGLRKSDLVRMGHELGVPLELTWSCYRSWSSQCGKCGTCTERREAFQLAGLHDPTNYVPGGL